MKHIFTLLFLLAGLPFLSLGEADSGQLLSPSATQFRYDNLSLGWPDQPGTIVNRQGYAFCYSEEHEQPLWVMYKLTKDEVLNKMTKRRDNFRKDPLIPTGSALLSDFKGSGYDRGHLAPAADMAWSKQAMSESFYLSNMSPQKPELNRGRWKDLEALVRNWAVENQTIYVITGPIIRPNHATIGPNQVTVPQWYYKIILDTASPTKKSIAFLMPNRKCEKSCQSYAVSIDKIEEITGLDFFDQIQDATEESIEKSFSLSQWSFKPYRPSSTYVEPPKTVAPSTLYWISSSSSTRHNSSCRYFKKSKGRLGSHTEGTACKSCGG